MQGWEAPVPIFTNLFKGFNSYTGIPFVNKPGPDKSQRVKKKISLKKIFLNFSTSSTAPVEMQMVRVKNLVLVLQLKNKPSISWSQKGLFIGRVLELFYRVNDAWTHKTCKCGNLKVTCFKDVVSLS